MVNTTKTRRSALAASIVAALALARCDDLPGGPTEPDPGSGAGTEGPAPVACITTEPNPPEVSARQSIVLDGGCSANVSSSATFQWDLGDGQTAAGRRVEARYRRSGDYTVRLSVHDRGATSEAIAQVQVLQRPNACFVFRQVVFSESGTEEPCTVAFDAICSTGSVKEYRWFFEGGVRPDGSSPDTNVTTKDPQITHDWRADIECMAFRPFDRLVRLTVVDEAGATDSHEETVEFIVPFLRP